LINTEIEKSVKTEKYDGTDLLFRFGREKPATNYRASTLATVQESSTVKKK
jgi:hypothetical protein